MSASGFYYDFSVLCRHLIFGQIVKDGYKPHHRLMVSIAASVAIGAGNIGVLLVCISDDSAPKASETFLIYVLLAAD